MKERRLRDQRGDGLVKDVTARPLELHARNGCSSVNILNMGEAGISPHRKTTGGRDESEIAVYLILGDVKENLIKVLHGLKKDPELWGARVSLSISKFQLFK